MGRLITHDHNDDGIDRRGFLECMAWAGTGVLWTVSGGVLSSQAFGQNTKNAKGALHFVQISDSHVGFNKPANPDVVATLHAAVNKINELPSQPDFLIAGERLAVQAPNQLAEHSAAPCSDQVFPISRIADPRQVSGKATF